MGPSTGAGWGTWPILVYACRRRLAGNVVRLQGTRTQLASLCLSCPAAAYALVRVMVAGAACRGQTFNFRELCPHKSSRDFISASYQNFKKYLSLKPSILKSLNMALAVK